MMQKDFAALTPPMGWNSWDCYASGVNEEQLPGNAAYMEKHLNPLAGNILSAISSGPILRREARKAPISTLPGWSLTAMGGRCPRKTASPQPWAGRVSPRSQAGSMRWG